MLKRRTSPITCSLCFSRQMMASNLLMTAYTSDVTTPTATASFLARNQQEIRECEPYSANRAETSMRVSPTSYSSSSSSRQPMTNAVTVIWMNYFATDTQKMIWVF